MHFYPVTLWRFFGLEVPRPQGEELLHFCLSRGAKGPEGHGVQGRSSTRTNLSLEKLRIPLRLSHDLCYLSHASYEHAIRSVHEIGVLLGGWRKLQERV